MARRSRWRWLAAIAACGFAASACSLLYDLGGYAGEAPLDASSGVLEGGGPTDADAGAPTDAAGDGRVDGSDARAPTFCEGFPDATFCDEFDRDAALGEWSRIRADNGGTVDIVREDGGSFLRARVVSGENVQRAHLERSFASFTAKKHVHYRYRMRVADLPPDDGYQVMNVGIGNANIGFFLNPQGFVFFEQGFGDGGTFVTGSLSSGIEPGVFHDIDVDVALDVFPAVIEIRVDGARVVQRASTQAIRSATTNFVAGFAYSNPTPAGQLDIADVLVEID